MEAASDTAETSRKQTDRDSPLIVRYIYPDSASSFLAMFQFLSVTGLIYAWLRHGPDMPLVGGFVAHSLFDQEWKFHMAVFFHAAILVKRWMDVIAMAKKLRTHRRQTNTGGRAMGPSVLWLVSAFLEGWRCERRFDEEVVRLRTASTEETKNEQKKNR